MQFETPTNLIQLFIPQDQGHSVARHQLHVRFTDFYELQSTDSFGGESVSSVLLHM
jgi:hypothetical protein